MARQLGVDDESLRAWVEQSEIDAGQRAGLTTAEQAFQDTMTTVNEMAEGGNSPSELALQQSELTGGYSVELSAVNVTASDYDPLFVRALGAYVNLSS